MEDIPVKRFNPQRKPWSKNVKESQDRDRKMRNVWVANARQSHRNAVPVTYLLINGQKEI
jgi:hypothetical protein